MVLIQGSIVLVTNPRRYLFDSQRFVKLSLLQKCNTSNPVLWRNDVNLASFLRTSREQPRYPDLWMPKVPGAAAQARHRPRLFLIDSFGFIFRAYHARARSGAPPMRTTTGISTEAVYIFHNMVRKLRADYHPEYIAAIFESGKTFREEAFAGYKANRTEMPPDLGEQIPYIRRLLDAMRIPVLQYRGFEADDVIGAMARRASEDYDVVIVSSDKDMLQLVDDRVHMYNPVKEDIWYDPATTEQFMGVKPTQVADLLALMGDSVDNIPGAPGIGEKGARDLIQRFGSVEAAHRTCRRGGAQDVSREPAEQSRADPAEQASGDHRHDGAGGSSFGGPGDARAGPGRAEEDLQGAGVL